jgi:alpha-ribazole phosphatase
MKRLILVRHTATSSAPETCHGGGTELELAATFEHEVEILRKELPSCVTHFHSSPLRRCEILARRIDSQAAWQIDPRLAEIHFGDWEGRRWDQLSGPALDAWMDDFVNVHPPGGENALDVAKRTRSFLKGLEEGTHLAITHGGVIRVLLSDILGFPMANLFQIEIPFGCIVELSWKFGRWSVERIAPPLAR